MERKIGEIFEFKKDWYQCVEGRCKDCHFQEKRFLCKQLITKDFCTHGIIFKKLKKVGEPYYSKYSGKFYQKYITYIPAVCNNFKVRINPVEYVSGTEIYVEIKQKEDMEENKLNLKPFDIQKAREGKPVCTRDGRKARIICFDKHGGLSIVALVETKVNGRISEEIALFYIDGSAVSADIDSKLDLMMLPEKKEGWVNVYKERIYDTKEEAIEATYDGVTYIDTIKISWEE